MQASRRLTAGIGIFAVLVTLVVTGPVTAAGVPLRYVDIVFDTVDVTRDVPYGEAVTWNGTPVTLRADVYEPRGDPATNRRAVVLVHGGGFAVGSKSNLAAEGMELARRGYVAVSVDYRLVAPPQMTWCSLAPEGPECDQRLPAAIADAAEDVGEAIGVIREHAGEMRVDPDAIAVFGHSAGAVTSLYLARGTIPGSGGEPAPTPSVQAAVSLMGAVAPEDMVAGAAPSLLVHGTEDTVVPYAAVEEIHATGLTLGNDSRLLTHVGAGHGFDAEETEVTRRHVVAFLDDVLQPAGRDRVEVVLSGGQTGAVAGRLAEGDIRFTQGGPGRVTGVSGSGRLATPEGVATVSIQVSSILFVPLWFGSIRVSGGGLPSVSMPVFLGSTSASAARAYGSASWFTGRLVPFTLHWSVEQA
ncbi:MAG: alpha/beta hydrolase [Acidimicrobiia bacterium]|nr:alpha/beta hydrolase [Acidimicrobiia bacterium]